MHVGLLIYGSLAIVSGGFLYDRRLVEHLRAQGDRVEVISLPWRGYGRSLLDNLNPGLRRRLATAAFDVLLQDELAHPSCFALNRRLRRRVAYPLVGIVHHLRCREPRPAWQNFGYRRVEQGYLASLDAFICVSRTTRRDVEDLVGTRRPLVVAPPGKDGLPGGLTPEAISARCRAPGPLQIIFVGNLIPRKELHTLLAALAKLPRDDWRLTVVVSLEMDAAYVGAVRGRIRKAGLADRVALLGTLPPGDLAAWCAASHVLAVPSSYEGFGIVYLEGMQFGLPAIASTAGAAGELIRHGDNGWLVAPGDAGALAQLLHRLLDDREWLRRLSLAARTSARGHATWQESAAQARAFLLGLAGSGRGSVQP